MNQYELLFFVILFFVFLIGWGIREFVRSRTGKEKARRVRTEKQLAVAQKALREIRNTDVGQSLIAEIAQRDIESLEPLELES